MKSIITLPPNHSNKILTLMNVYSQYSNTQNMKSLVNLFGKERVVSVMQRNKKDSNIEIINDTATQNFTSKNFAPFII